MGWATDLQQASFRRIEFECVSTNDAGTKSLSIKQSPYSNDAEIEDMGNDPRKISLRIFLTGDDYKLWLDALITAFEISGAGELVHPIFGIKNVNAANWSVGHDTETVDGCYIDVDFVVAKAERKTLFVPTRLPAVIDVKAVIAPSAAAVQKELEQLNRIDPNKFLEAAQTIRNGLQSARRALGNTRATVDTVLSPADWAVGIVNDVTSLVTFDVTDISAVGKWRSLVERTQRIANVFDGESGTNSIVNNASFKQLWRAVTTTSIVATAQAVVTNIRNEMAQGNDNVSMTPPDLAVIRQRVRQTIRDAIALERASVSETLVSSNIDAAAQVAIYKNVADQIHLQIQALIETRPPITTTTIVLPCVMYWLAHNLYGDMSRAEELKRLNPTLQNPAAIQIGVELTSYAS